MTDTLTRIVAVRYLRPFAISLAIGVAAMYFTFFPEQGFHAFGTLIPFRVSLAWLTYNLGWTISLILPLAVGLSTVLVYARLPYDLILKSPDRGTFSFAKTLYPAVTLVGALSVLFFLHNAFLLPEMNHASKEQSIAYKRYYAYPDSLRSTKLLDERWDTQRGLREINLISQFNALADLSTRRAALDPGSREVEILWRQSQLTWAEIHKTFSLSIAPVIAVLLMAPIGFLSRNQRGPTVAGYGLTFCILYAYPLIFGNFHFLTMQVSSLLPWVADGFMLLLATPFLFWARRTFHRIHTLAKTVAPA